MEVGVAFISLAASARDFVRDIASQIGGLGDVGDQAGDQAGEGFGNGFKLAAVAGVAAAGAAVGATFAAALSMDAATDKLAAQLGLTESESARIGDVAGSLYADAYGGSIEDVNVAVGAVVSSIGGMRDASSSAVEDMTARALDLAGAFDLDIGRAAQVAGQMITSGLAGDGVEAMDLLTAAMQRVPAAVREDVLDAADEYGPFMSSLGLQGEQAFGLLVTAAEKGMFGIDKTGDALKEFTIRATDMSSASKVGYDALGLSQQDMTNKLLAGGETAAGAFGEIITGLQGIKDPATQSQAALALFGTPLEDLSVQEIPKFLAGLTGASDAMAGTAGASDALGTTLNANASTSWTSIIRQSQMFAMGLANKALPAITDTAGALASGFGPAVASAAAVVGELAGAVAAASGWLREHSTVTTVLAGIIGTILLPVLIRTAVGYATAGVAAVTSAATQSAAWLALQVRTLAYAAIMAASYALTVAGWVAMAAAAVVNAAVVVAGWVLMGAQSLIQAARMAAAWVIAMGPVGWVIAAVVALVALIVANWDTIVAATGKAWDWVTGKLGAAWDWIKSTVASAAAAVVGALASAWESVKSATSSAWEAVTGAVSAGISAVVSFVTGLPGRALSALSGMASSLAGSARAAWNAYQAAVSAGVGIVLSFVSGIPGRIVSGLGNLGSLLTSAGGDLLRGLANGVTGAIGGVIDAAKKAARAAVDAVKGALGISSPSKVFAALGVNVGEGFAQGIAGSGGLVQKAMGGLTDVGDLAGLRVGGTAYVMGRLAVSPPAPAAAPGVISAPEAGRGMPTVHIENMHVRDETEAARKLEQGQRNALAVAGLA